MDVYTHWGGAGNGGAGGDRGYIAHCQNTVVHYITTCPIMDLCLVAEWRTGLNLYMRWWEHRTIYILRIRAGHVALEGGGGDGGRRIGRKGRAG